MIRIKQLRQEAHLSLRDLSSKLNIAYSSLGKYERGEQQPSIETLIKIANYFEVTVDYLLGVTSCKDPSNINIEKSLGLSENAINLLKKYTQTTYSLDNETLILSDMLNKTIIHPSFTKILKLLATFSHYTNKDWTALGEKMSLDSETAKSLLLSRISKEFDSLMLSLINNNEKFTTTE